MTATVTFEPTESMIREPYAGFNPSLPTDPERDGNLMDAEPRAATPADLHARRRRHQRAGPDEQERTLARSGPDLAGLVGRRLGRASIRHGACAHGRHCGSRQEARRVRSV